MRTPLVPLVLAGLLSALPAQGQDPPGHPMPMRPGMPAGMGMMQGMMPGPSMILHLRGPLELTDRQVEQVEAIHARVHPQVHQSMQQAMQLHRQAMAALMGSAPDPDRHDALLRQAAEQMVSAHSRMARAMVEAQQVLTPEQRGNLRFAMRAMPGMHGMMEGMDGGRGMMHPPSRPDSPE